MFDSLDHIVIGTDDIATAQSRMVALLGRTPSWTTASASQDTESVLFRLSNTDIELRAPRARGPMAAAIETRLRVQGPGLCALAFGSQDLAACRPALEAAGLAPEAAESGLSQDAPSGAFRRYTTLTLPPDRTGDLPIYGVQHHTAAEEIPAGSALAERGIVEAIDHVVVMTQQPKRALAIYGHGLGLRLALDRADAERSLRLLFFRVGGLSVEVAASLGEDGATAGLGTTGSDRDRLWGLAYRVANVDAAHERLRAAGFELTPVRKGRKPGTRVFTVKDSPCGVATLVIEDPARE